MNEPFNLDPIQPDGTRVMIVRGVEFLISAQSLPDEVWDVKLQLKANLFAQKLNTVLY